MKSLRPATAEEMAAKDVLVNRFTAAVAPWLGTGVALGRSARDLSAVNWLYAEGLDEEVGAGTMTSGFPLFLGDVFVAAHGFEWVAVSDEASLHTVWRRPAGVLVDLHDLTPWYSPEIDPRDEPPDFGERVLCAYEAILKEVKRKELGLIIPKPG